MPPIRLSKILDPQSVVRGFWLNHITLLVLCSWFLLPLALAKAALGQLDSESALSQSRAAWHEQAMLPRMQYQLATYSDYPEEVAYPIETQPMRLLVDPEVRPAGVTNNTLPTTREFEEVSNPALPLSERDGAFQRIFFTGTWIPSTRERSLGLSELETGVVLGLPCCKSDAPFLITPRFAVHYLNWSSFFYMPARVYDASLEFRHLRKFADDRWSMDVAVNVGYYSDFSHDHSDALRMTGRGFVQYESSSEKKWVLGAAYLNRAGASVLPIAGVIYEPSSEVSYQLVFPRPKLSRRMSGISIPGRDEKWVYLGGELGGGAWSIENRELEDHRLLTYRDIRLLLGYERKITGGMNRFFEVGYVFEREFAFDDRPSREIADSLYLRMGLNY